jgi:hypothetical protein
LPRARGRERTYSERGGTHGLRCTDQDPVHLPELRRGERSLAGQVRRLRRVERVQPRERRGGAGCPTSWPRTDYHAGRARRQLRRPATGQIRNCRIRPGNRRRVRARLHAAGRRRPGHREVHAAPSGRGRAGLGGALGGVHLGRGSGGAGAPARGPARFVASAGKDRSRDQRRRHPSHAGGRPAAGPAHPRFDPDAVDGRCGIGTRNRDASARERPGVDPLRQGNRHGHRLRRPRYQGRPDRRAKGRGAYGRRRTLFRRRRWPRVPYPPRRQESLRPHRRNRRLRNDRRRAAGGRQSVGPVPRRARNRDPRSGGLSQGWRGPDPCWWRYRHW